MPRNPKDIAAELRELHDTSSRAFVPMNIAKAMELSVEFAESVSATLDAAGLIPVRTETAAA